MCSCVRAYVCDMCTYLFSVCLIYVVCVCVCVHVWEYV